MAGFQDDAREAFAFLESQGYQFSVGRENPLAEVLTWRGELGAVVLTRLRDGELSLHLGRIVKDQPPFDIDELHLISDIVAWKEGETQGKSLVEALERQPEKGQIHGLADFVKAYGKEVLAGDKAAFDALELLRAGRKRKSKDLYLDRHNFPPEAYGGRKG